MKLEKQVCSLELAKKLKELGVKQESLFIWHKPWIGDWAVSLVPPSTLLYPNRISAFTVAELGEMLEPHTRCINRQVNNSFIYTVMSPLYKTYWEGGEHKEEADTEANARAKMLIYLLENKFTNPSADKAGEKERGV